MTATTANRLELDAQRIREQARSQMAEDAGEPSDLLGN